MFLRHGEKPSGGYGQLTCQGLNRSLALPDVLLAKYGKPTYLYAPNPAVQITDAADDTLFVVRVNYAGGTATARFSTDREGLNGQSTTCP